MLRSELAMLMSLARLRTARIIALLVLPLVAAGAALQTAHAHDLPDQLNVRVFAKPEDQRLHVIARVPLALLEAMALPKRGPGYLDLPRLDEPLERSALAVARSFVFLEDGARLAPERAAWRISQPSEDAFGSFDQARAHVLGEPMPDTANVFWNQGYFDIYYEYPISSVRSNFALQTQGLGLDNILKLFVEYLPPDGPVRVFEVHADGRTVPLDPSWFQAALTFTKLGFDHILEGIDHLFFLLCLVLPFRLQHVWSLIAVVTSFTVAHSITLIAAATGVVPAGDWFPPLVETLIALSIVYMAVENVVCAWFSAGGARQLSRRWLITGAFGLIHGFGFSFALQEQLQFAGAHLVSSLLAFNVGVELGQIAFLAIVLPVLSLLLRSANAQRAGIIIGSAFLAHTGWHWMLERVEALRYVRWPELEVGNVALIGAVVLLALAALVALRQGRAFVRRRARGAEGD